MASISETGHAKNVTNLASLISSIIAFDISYNPSKESIKLRSLQTLLTSSNNALEAANTAQSAYTLAVDAREIAFQSLGKLITRVNNALKASDSTEQIDQSAQTIIRKLQGKRATTKLTDEEIKTLEADGTVVNQISVSQMSYDSRLGNFDKLISLLASVPQYNPNEEELKIETLKTLLTTLKTKNNEVVAAYIQVDNARISRNQVLYNPSTGLVDLATDSKNYIKSVFGSSSPQYKQVSKLTFVSRN